MNRETSMFKHHGEAAEKLQQRPFVAPAVDIYENADELLIVADLPGVDGNDVTLHFEKGQLSIDARRRDVAEGTRLAAEFRPFDFRRVFGVPQGINADKIAAEVNQGVLRVHLPKVEALRPRQIQVKSS